MAHHESFVKELAQSIRSHTPMPAFPSNLTLDEAYSLLPKVAALVADHRVCGIKAGMTNPDMAKLFGVDEALLGLLYDWGECQPNTALAWHEHALIECEFGIRLNDEGLPTSIGPAIEVVRLDFSKPEDFSSPNLVVCSLGADRFICGEQTPWQEMDFEALRDITIKLSRDGQLLLQASPYESLDGPERALRWCVKEAERRNIEITDNALLLTGTCGSALPAIPGQYTADYGMLGRITFDIEKPASQ